MSYSVVKKSELNTEFRLDAEYYRKEILDKIKCLPTKNTNTLGTYVNFVVGPFGSTVTVDKYVEKSDFKYIRNKDINDFRINDNDPAYISEELYNSLETFHLKENDLLLTVVGTLGKVAIATKEDSTSIFSCKSTLLRVKNKKMNPYYLLSYLNSNIGQLFVKRGKRGAIQEGLNLSDLKEIIVYETTDKFQEKIEKIVKKAFSLNKMSEELFQDAKELLFNELALNEYKTMNSLTNVISFSKVQKAERFDAEYFQPKYEEFESKVKQYKGGYSLIDDICTNINYGSVPTSKYTQDDNDVTYIKGMNLFNTKVVGPFDKIVKTKKLLTKHFVEKDDIIISQMGTVGNVGVVTEDLKNATFASFTIRIRVKNKMKFRPYYVALYIQSIAKDNYLLRNIAQASVRQNTDLPTIKNMYIPNLYIDIQEKIEQLVKTSIDMELKSNQLLEISKNAVDIVINSDENTAISWIESELNGLGVDLDG